MYGESMKDNLQGYLDGKVTVAYIRTKGRLRLNNGRICPNPACGSAHIVRLGVQHTKKYGTVQRFRCVRCKRCFR